MDLQEALALFRMHLLDGDFISTVSRLQMVPRYASHIYEALEMPNLLMTSAQSST